MMGMTIDKSIEFYNGLECYTPQAKEARDILISTARKYQKIEEIVTEWENENDPKIKFARSNMEKVKEVLEDES